MSIIKRDQIPEILLEHKDCIYVVNILSHKWALMLLLILKEPMRFGQLRRKLGISPSVLSKELNYLEKLNMINRTVLLEYNPPSVEYSLSQYGTELRKICMDIQQFGCKLVEIIPDEAPDNIYKNS